MSMALMARVVRPRRPTSFGTHSLCHNRSTLIGSSPMSWGVKCSMASPTRPRLVAPMPMPVTPSSVSMNTNPTPLCV